MFATYSDENHILRIIADHGLSLQFVSGLAQQAGIARCSLQTLSAGLNAGRGLRDTGPYLLKLLRRLDDFAKKYEPVKVEFSNAADVYGWLEAERRGELRMVVDASTQSSFIQGLLSGLSGEDNGH